MKTAASITIDGDVFETTALAPLTDNDSSPVIATFDNGMQARVRHILWGWIKDGQPRPPPCLRPSSPSAKAALSKDLREFAKHVSKLA